MEALRDEDDAAFAAEREEVHVEAEVDSDVSGPDDVEDEPSESEAATSVPSTALVVAQTPVAERWAAIWASMEVLESTKIFDGINLCVIVGDPRKELIMRLFPKKDSTKIYRVVPYNGERNSTGPDFSQPFIMLPPQEGVEGTRFIMLTVSQSLTPDPRAAYFASNAVGPCDLNTALPSRFVETTVAGEPSHVPHVQYLIYEWFFKAQATFEFTIEEVIMSTFHPENWRKLFSWAPNQNGSKQAVWQVWVGTRLTTMEMAVLVFLRQMGAVVQRL